MGESQCPLCGHIVTGFEQQDFEVKRDEHAALHARIAELEAEVARLKSLVGEMYNLSDNWPGVAYTEDLAARVAAELTPAQPKAGGEG